MKGLILFLAIIVLVVNADHNDFKNYLSTYLQGLGGDGGVKRLEHCIKYPDVLLKEIKVTMNYVRDMTDSSLKEGARYLKGVTEKLVLMLFPCTDHRHVLRKLGEIAFKTSEHQIAKKFKDDMGQHFHLATTAFAALSEKKFDVAGTNVGVMTSKIFLATDLGSSMQSFITGFAKSLGEQKKLDDLLKCAKEDETIFKAFNESSDLIRTMNAAKMLKGSEILLTVTKKFMKTLAPCLSSYEEFKKLEGKLKHADPQGMVKIMGRAISTFFHLSNDAVEAFGLKKYDNAGKAIGAMQKNLFLK